MLRRCFASMTNTAKPVKLRAALFDLDGTLMDTDGIHHEIWKKVCVDSGHTQRAQQECSLEFFQANISGQHNAQILKNIFTCELFPELYDADGRADEHKLAAIADAKEELFRKHLLDANDTAPMPGVPELFASFDAHQVPHAVVTNAPRNNAETMLRAIALLDRFASNNLLFIGDECDMPKPSPIPYVTAMKRLSQVLEERGEAPLQPEECVVFEDSPAGTRAGVAAKMHTIGVGNSNPPQALLKEGAVLFVQDYSQLNSLQAIENAIAGALKN